MSLTSSERHARILCIAKHYYFTDRKQLVAGFELYWRQEWRDYLLALQLEDVDKCFTMKRGKQNYYHSNVAQCHISLTRPSGYKTRGICYGFLYYIVPMFDIADKLLPDLRYLVWKYLY